MEVVKISGNEPVHELIEWYDRVLTKLESCMPGARDVLVLVMEHKIPLTFDDLSRIEPKRIAHRLNSELYSWLYNVCTLKAWTFLKSVPQGQGLEAFRLVYQQVTRRTPQQLEAEFRFLNKPEGPKLISDVSHWLVSWENRLSMLYTMNKDYGLSDQSRKNVAYEAMPEQLPKILDQGSAKGNLATWRMMKDFLINFSDSESVNKTGKPMPISANVVAEEQAAPQDPEYSSEQWLYYLEQTSEGQEFAVANPTHPQVQAYVLSVVVKGKGKGWKGYGKGDKGKGKGFGKDGKGDKGKGKGAKGKGFQCNCYTCGQFGHSSRNCPRNQQANLAQDSNPANGWNSMALLCTEQPVQTQAQKQILHLAPKDVAPITGSKYFPMTAEETESTACAPPPDTTSPETFPPVSQSMNIPSNKKMKPKTVSPDEQETLAITEYIQSNCRPKTQKKKNKNKKKNPLPQEHEDAHPADSKFAGAKIWRPETCGCMGCQSPVPGTGRIAEDEASPNCIFNPDGSLKEAERKTMLAHVTTAIENIEKRIEAQNHQHGSNCGCHKRDALSPPTLPKTDDYDPNMCLSCSEGNDDNITHDDNNLTYPDLCSFLGHKSDECLVIGDAPHGAPSILNTDEMVWAKVAIASDSGCVRHVTPKNIFSTDIMATERSKSGHKYYGANNSPITNHGGQKAIGETGEGVHLTMDFDVADVSRPLLSITGIIQKKRHRAVYDDPVSYIEDKVTGRRANLRFQDNLFFLDVWVKIPKALANSPFVRLVAP